jgi:hypothetical protein
MTVKKYLPALFAIALSFAACPQPTGPENSQPDKLNIPDNYVGPVTLKVDGHDLGMTVDTASANAIAITFPKAAWNTSGAVVELKMPQDVWEKLYANVVNGKSNTLTFAPGAGDVGGKNVHITAADQSLILDKVKEAIKAATGKDVAIAAAHAGGMEAPVSSYVLAPVVEGATITYNVTAVGNGTSTLMTSQGLKPFTVSGNALEFVFSRDLRNLSSSPTEFNISEVDIRSWLGVPTDSTDKSSFPAGFTFKTASDSLQITSADINTIIGYINSQLANKVTKTISGGENVTRYVDGTEQGRAPNTNAATPVSMSPVISAVNGDFEGYRYYMDEYEKLTRYLWKITSLGSGNSLTINSKNVALAVVDGKISLDFPQEWRDKGATGAALNLEAASLQTLYNIVHDGSQESPGSLSSTLEFRGMADSLYIRNADMEAIKNFINTQIASAIKQQTQIAHDVESMSPTYNNSGSPVSVSISSAATPASGTANGLTNIGNDTYASYNPSSHSGNVWGNVASMTIPAPNALPGQAITIAVTVTNDGSNAAPVLNDIAALVANIPAGSDRPVEVTYSHGGVTANDKIRFNVVTALYSALKARTTGAITQKGDAASPVHPLFNGDDLFSVSVNTGGTTVNTVAGKVFKEYTIGQEIFDGFKVKQNSGKWYIDNEGNKPLTIEKLSVFKSNNNDYLDGFGLKVNSGFVTYVSNPTLAGGVSFSGFPNAMSVFTPEHLDAALGLLGLDYSNGASQLFTIDDFRIMNAYSGVTPANLKDYKTLAFLEKYMHSPGDLAKLSGLSFSNYLNVTGSNPYVGNTISASEQLPGTLVWFLLDKLVHIYEVYATNPDLTILGGTLNPWQGVIRNSVFEGANWGVADFKDVSLRGVVTSKDTPFARVDGSNQRLWYVVQGNDGSTAPLVPIRASVLEIDWDPALPASEMVRLRGITANLIIPNSGILPKLAIANSLDYEGLWYKGKYALRGAGAVDGRPRSTLGSSSGVWNVVGAGGTNNYNKQTFAEGVIAGNVSATNEAGVSGKTWPVGETVQ